MISRMSAALGRANRLAISGAVTASLTVASAALTDLTRSDSVLGQGSLPGRCLPGVDSGSAPPPRPASAPSPTLPPSPARRSAPPAAPGFRRPSASATSRRPRKPPRPNHREAAAAPTPGPHHESAFPSRSGPHWCAASPGRYRSPRSRRQALNQFNQGGNRTFHSHRLNHLLGPRCPDVSLQSHNFGNGLDSLLTPAMIRPCETTGAS